MGLGSSLKKALGKVAKPVAKVISTATSAAAGFVGGGSVGALAGTVKGVIANSQTSKAATINLGTVGTDVAIGAVTNIAAGALAAGGKAVLAAGPGTGLGAKAGAFFKGGGLAGTLKQSLPKIISGAAGIFGGGGKVANPDGLTPAQSNTEQSNVAQIVRSGYDKLRANPKVKSALKDVSNEIQNGGGFEGAANKIRGYFPGMTTPQTAPGQAPVVLNNDPQSYGGGPNYLIIGAIALGAYLLLRKRSGFALG